MSAPRVAYYAAHHGRGHVTRAAAVLRHVRAEATLFSSADPPHVPPGVRFERLPADDPRDAADVRPAGPFHYAPVGHPGLRRRMARLASGAAEGAGVLVADVSAEVATFGRLLSLPVVAVRQHGRRWDDGHLLAYRLAARLLAPFPPRLEEPDAPAWVREKTVYAGGFSRFDGRRVEAPPAPRTVVVMGGGGDSGSGSASAWSPADVAEAARAVPSWRWKILGASTPGGAPPNVEGLGWVEDPLPVMARAAVVVAHGGHNAVMEAAAADRPLVVIPAERPFEEQRRKAAALARSGAAVARDGWPPPDAWGAVLAEAEALDPAPLRSLVDGHGARRAAALLDWWAETAARALEAGPWGLD